MRDKIRNEYFAWLYNLACARRYPRQVSFKKLLIHLHRIEFRYSMPNDGDRAEDGMDLRRRFILLNGYEEAYDEIMDALDGPCSVLELIVGIAIRCEETIMDDPSVGDRTGQWFWFMIVNLDLGSMTDDLYDRRVVDMAVTKFMNRDYEPDGKGGLFWIKHCESDLREIEIWRQMCWYLDSVTDI